MCIGSILSTIISVSQEKVARHLGKLSSTPEGRLYFSCVQSTLLPIGLFWFGWTLSGSIHWIVPTIAIGCATMGIFSIYLAVFNYLADTYHRYASSALAAQSFCMFHEARSFVKDIADTEKRSKYFGRSVSAHCRPNVQKYDVSWCFKLSGRSGKIFTHHTSFRVLYLMLIIGCTPYHSALGPSVLRSKDSSEEQICER